MLRVIAGVVFGYIAMAIVVSAGLTGAYMAMGADGAFQSGTYDVSLLWVIISIVVGFAAALLGGWLSRKIAITRRGPRALAAVVVVLGFILALAALFADPAATTVRDGLPGPMEAMQQAKQPLWILLINPLVGAFGVLLGGRALDRTPEATPHHEAIV